MQNHPESLTNMLFLFTQVITVLVKSVTNLDSGGCPGAAQRLWSVYVGSHAAHITDPHHLSVAAYLPMHLETSNQSCHVCLNQRCFF